MNRSSGLWWGVILIVIGAFFLLENLDIVSLGDVVRDYWPVLFVLWGLWMLTREATLKPKHPLPPLGRGTAGGNQVFGDILQETDADTTSYSNVFGDVKVRVASQCYKGGVGSTVFGNSTLDLSQTALADGEQVVRHSGVFGNLVVYLAPGTSYMVYAHSLFGGIESPGEQKREGISSTLTYQVPGYSTTAKKIKLELSTVFGNIKVIM